MELPIKLKKKDNAIKEAVISLFLSSPIIKPERFQDLIQDAELKDFFQSFQKVGSLSFSLENFEGKFTNKENKFDDIGFKLLRFVEGKPEFVLQGINEGNRNFFSFHELMYKRWADFLKNFKNILDAVRKVQSEIFLTGISLHYVDEFIWIEEGNIDLSKIMTPKDYLPQNFINIKSGHLINTREIETKNDDKLFDRMEILLTSNIAKTVTISHNQNFRFANLIDLKEKDSYNYIGSSLQKLHESNKKFLKDVLLTDVKKLIGLE